MTKAKVRQPRSNFGTLPDCHCERSEAIQNIRRARLDCFVALLLAMTKMKTRPISVGAIGVERLGNQTIDTVLLGQNLSFITPGQASAVGGVIDAGIQYHPVGNVSLFISGEGTAMSATGAIAAPAPAACASRSDRFPLPLRERVPERSEGG
jgi:hypothetical protein